MITRSIRNRLALSATGLVLAVVGVIAGAAFVEARRTTTQAATARLREVSRQLGDMFGASARSVLDQSAAIAQQPRLIAFLSDRSAPASSAARAVMTGIQAAPNSLATVELWDAQGHRLLATVDSVAPLPNRETAALMGLAAAPESVAVGWIGKRGGQVGYAVIARVGRGSPSGFLVEQRRLVTTAQAAAQFRDLVGSGAALAIGNARGDFWSDLVDSVPGPVLGTSAFADVVEYERPRGTPVLAAITSIAHTPWLVAVEFPRAATLAPVYAMLVRLAWFTLALLIVATVGAWVASGSLTRPIDKLVAAVNAMAAGDADHRVDAKRDDEIGTLGRAFNAMADRLTRGRESLEHKIVELEDAEARYRLLFDGSPQPMWVYDVQTRRFLAANAAAMQRYGYSPDEFLTMTVADLRPPRSEPASSDDPAMEDADRGADSAVSRHRIKTGALIEVEMSSRALLFGGRRARLVLVNDLTNRRRAEESLRAAQQRLERVIGSSGAVLFELRIADGDTELEWISDNVTSMLGYDLSEVRSPLWWTNNLHPADRARSGSRRLGAAHQDGAVEYRFRHKDGRYRLLREDQRPITDDAGTVTKVIGAWMDLTEQRQLEAQFRQAQKMEAVGRLAGGVAHDFNNLLTVILAECQFLLNDPGMAVAMRTECIDQVGKAAERAALLTRQLLTFSRQQLIEPATLDLNAVVTDVDKMLRRLIGEDVDLRVSLGNKPAITVADRGQIEQVIVNLAVNARDAMPVGGVLTIETGRTTLDQSYADTHANVVPGEYVLLAVSDTGIGMDEEVKSHIFEPFFTTKDDGKGTGLGLATCYAIARQFGGHIAAYSELGLGTTMKVYLPCRDAPAPVPSSSVVEEQSGSETILLVEDDEHVRRLTARMLEARGHTVLQAADATAALSALERHPTEIHLLLTDVVLPGMGGRALADRVLELRPGMSVLFASGYSDDVILQHRLTAHGVILLHKPFTADTLMRKVREALRRPELV